MIRLPSWFHSTDQRSAAILCGGLLSILLFSPLRAEETQAWHSYQEVAKALMLDRWIGLPASERDHVTLQLKIDPDAAGNRPHFFLQRPGENPTMIPMDAQGFLSFPLDAKLLATNPLILKSAGFAKSSAELSITPVMPAGTEFHYRDLMDAVVQANDDIAKVAGLKRFLIPTIRAVVLQYPKGTRAECRILVASQELVLHPDAEGKIRIAADAGLSLSNPLVQLSEPPLGADFD